MNEGDLVLPSTPAARGINGALEEIETDMGIIYDARVAKSCIKLFREKGVVFE